jgi:hypothetical protein
MFLLQRLHKHHHLNKQAFRRLQKRSPLSFRRYMQWFRKKQKR